VAHNPTKIKAIYAVHRMYQRCTWMTWGDVGRVLFARMARTTNDASFERLHFMAQEAAFQRKADKESW
jgi:hypothetical protein